MSNIDKQWLQQKIADMEAARDEIPFGLDEEDSNTLAALRIALASLEAEPVCVIDQFNLDYLKSGSDADVWPASRTEMGDVLLYRSATPAPVVPDDVMAAIQKVARIRLDLNDFDGDKRGILDCLGDAEEELIEVVNRRAAMLQGAEPVTTANKLPFDQWLSQQTGTIDVECGCVMTEVFFHWLRVAYEAGNSPVIPDGWVMVPVEPTEEMCDVGHIGIDVLTGVTDENEYYSIDGEDAAKVYRAMIAAAPQQEVK